MRNKKILEENNHKYERCRRGDLHRDENGELLNRAHCGWCGDPKSKHPTGRAKR